MPVNFKKNKCGEKSLVYIARINCLLKAFMLQFSHELVIFMNNGLLHSLTKFSRQFLTELKTGSGLFQRNASDSLIMCDRQFSSIVVS